jgi:pyrroline-5-carboxylate reductase
VAATGWEQLLRWTGGRTRVSQAIPLPFVANRTSPTIVYPPDPETMRIFDAIGGAIGVESLREYEAAGVASALMAIAAGVQETSVRWLSENGMAPAAARAYVSGLNLGIATAALASRRRRWRTSGDTTAPSAGSTSGAMRSSATVAA